MEWNEGLGDTSLDDILNFADQRQGGKKKKRSSILKQSRYVNSEFCENTNDETVTEYRRKSQHMKRVSFAETFQVKELHTGNIYDIPGWNESSASKGSQSVEPKEDVTEGNFTSRSLVQDSPSVLEPAEAGSLKNSYTENYAFKSNESEIEVEPQYPFFGAIETSSAGIQFRNVRQPSYKYNKTVRDLLADDMDMMMVHTSKNWSINALDEKNYIEEVISKSVHTWQEGKGPVSSINDLYGDSLFKGNSQEYNDKENVSLLPAAGNLEDCLPKNKRSHFSNVNDGNKGFFSVPCDVGISRKNPQENLNYSNKENIFDISPNFKNLKCIDSPPSWMFGKEAVLKSRNKIDLKSQKRPLEDHSLSQINLPKGNTMKNNNEVFVQNPRNGLGLFPVTAEKGCFKKTCLVQNDDCVPRMVDSIPQILESLPFEEKNMNKTLHNAVSMDLTLLPEAFTEDSDVSYVQEQGGSLDLTKVSREDLHPGKSNKGLGMAINKTRLSTCDMEMTCLYESPLSSSPLCISPPNKPNTMHDAATFWEQDESVDLKLYEKERKCQRNENAFPRNDIRAAGDFRERTNNKTRLSTCDMDMTCMTNCQTEEDSFFVSPPKSVDAMFGDHKGTGEEFSAYVTSAKESFVNNRGVVSEATSLPLKETPVISPFDFSSDDEPSLPPNSTFHFDRENEEKQIKIYSDVSSSKNKSEKSETHIAFKDRQFCYDIEKISDAIENPILTQAKQNNISEDHSGQKYLKISSVPERIDRIQAQYSDKEIVSDSFEVKNKENLHLNRKRSMSCEFKSAKFPLGEKRNASLVSCHPKPGIISLEQKALQKNPCSPKITADNKMSRLLQSNAITISGRNVYLENIDKKYLKAPSVPEGIDRLQIRSFDNEIVSDSFEVKKEENLHSNRKISMSSEFNSAKSPLGEEKNVSDKLLSLVGCHSKPGIISSEQDALQKNPSLENSHSHEITADSKMSNLLLSKTMNISGRNMCLDNSVNASSPITKEVHILTNTNVLKDNVVITSSKYEKIRYSLSNSMDLTCLPESENASMLEDVFLETDTEAHGLDSGPELACNVETQSKRNSTSINRSSFRKVGSESLSVTDDQIGKYPLESVYDHRSLPQDCKYTQNFTSQDMELTCMKSKFQDDTQAHNGGGLKRHPEPPYFQLQEIPLVSSLNQENIDCNMNQSRGKGCKMFELCTDNFSLSKESKTSEIHKRSLSSGTNKNYSSELLSQGVEETSSKHKTFHDVLDSSSNLEAGNALKSVGTEKHSAKSQTDAFVTEISNVKPHTPGVIFNVRRIKESLKEGSNHIVLFPELSQVMKKQKFNLKYPYYSEIKISSPMCNPGKLSRSFNACSNETSFTCPSRKSSVHPSTSDSPRMLDLSPKENLLNPSVALYESQSEPKADVIPDGGQTSDKDESLQLLPYSALQSSFLDAASKNFTICLDRSDFVLKEPGSYVPPEQSLSLVQDRKNAPVENKIELEMVSDSQLQENFSLVYASHGNSDAINTSAAVDNETTLAKDVPCISAEISKSLSSSVLHDNFSLICSSQGKSEEINRTVTVNNKTPLAKDVPSNLAEFNKPTEITSIEDHSAKKSNSQSSEQTAEKIQWFKKRILENDISFPFSPLRNDALKATSSSKQKLSTPSKIPKFKSRKKDLAEVPISQENRSATNVDNIRPVACKTLNYSKAVVSAEIEEAINKTSIPEITVTDIQGEDPVIEEQRNLIYETNISADTLNEVHKPEFKIPPNDLPKKSEDIDLMQQTSPEESISEKEETLKKQVMEKSKNVGIDGNSRVLCNSIFLLDLNSWKEKFEKASSGEGMKWKLKSISEDSAVFHIFWQVFVFPCTLQVEVKHIGASQSSISFVPVGMNLRREVVESVEDDIQDRAYNYFQCLVTDTVLPFTICSENMINKMAEYSKIANDVELLMLDLLKVAVSGLQTISYELDPLKVFYQVCNDNYECVLDMTFHIDLKKYPQERIVPELKHRFCKDITKEVAIAVSSVEPGKDYLYRMIWAARNLKP